MPSRSFPAYPVSVPDARGYVTDALADLSERLRETAELLVSELVTNAVRYGSGPRVAVSVDVLPGERIRIGVTDDGNGSPVQRSPRVTDEHGRGLHLVGLLADRWGVRRAAGDQAKTVWFELAATRTPAGSSRGGTTVDDV